MWEFLQIVYYFSTRKMRVPRGPGELTPSRRILTQDAHEEPALLFAIHAPTPLG